MKTEKQQICVLESNFIRRWKRKSPVLAALGSVGGFLFVLFTYLGVSFLLRGLHSYL